MFDEGEYKKGESSRLHQWWLALFKRNINVL